LGGAGATWPPLSGLAVYLGVALTGWATGAQFPVANRLFWEAGSRIESSTSVTDSADHFGAAAGSLVLGVVFIPILGIQTACVMLATLKGASLIGVLAAAWISPNARE
jgi:predicted membrane-bound spermidine synthase